MRRFIIYLVRKRLGVKKFQNFRFTNQKDDSTYYFTNYDLRKNETVGEGENSYTRGIRANVSLNWLIGHKTMSYMQLQWRKINTKGLIFMEDWTKYEPKFRYMMLSRMKQDCDYYLGYGNRSKNHLWAGDEIGQIQNMKAIWNSFPDEDKPEWLTWDELLEYERKMT